MMHKLICAITAILLPSCDPGGLIIVETRDASVDAAADAPEDADEPVTPITDAAVCNCNGGTGVCTDPAKDCPPVNGCCYFECVVVPGQEYKVCRGLSKDGGI